jgi:hypothetical protein
MNRRKILTLLTGSAAGLSFQFASAADGNIRSPKSGPTRRGGSKRGAGAWPDLKLAAADHQVRSIAYARGAYSVTTANGKSAYFLENDLRFKIDSSDLGPDHGKPIIEPAGTEGDRAWILFSSPEEISAFIQLERS